MRLGKSTDADSENVEAMPTCQNNVDGCSPRSAGRESGTVHRCRVYTIELFGFPSQTGLFHSDRKRTPWPEEPFRFSQPPPLPARGVAPLANHAE